MTKNFQVNPRIIMTKNCESVLIGKGSAITPLGGRPW